MRVIWPVVGARPSRAWVVARSWPVHLAGVQECLSGLSGAGEKRRVDAVMLSREMGAEFVSLRFHRDISVYNPFDADFAICGRGP